MFEDYLGSLTRGIGINALAGVMSCSAAFAVRYSLAGLLIPSGYVVLEGVAWTISPASRSYSLYASVYVFGQGFDTYPLYPMSPSRAGIICLIAVTFASVAAAVIFSRRDVLV